MNVKMFVTGTALVSAAAGTAAGYFYAKHTLPKAILEKALADAKKEIDFWKDHYDKHYQKVHKAGAYSDPETLASKHRLERVPGATNTPEEMEQFPPLTDEELDTQGGDTDALQNALDKMKTKPWPGEDPRPAPEALLNNVRVNNVFNQAEGPDPHLMDNYRNAVKEYRTGATGPINDLEFVDFDTYMVNSEEYDCFAWDFYEGDEVLCDSEDSALGRDDIIKSIGSIENLNFGEMSSEPHTVYIRNNRTRCYYEINRRVGKYGVEVAGIEPS